MLDRQNAARTKKYAFLHNGNKVLAPRQIAHREREQKLLAERSEEEERGAVVLRPSVDQDARPASYDSFTSRQGARNAFMFEPDGVEDSVTTIAETAQEQSKAPAKRTNYEATRFGGLRTSAHDTDSIPPSPSISAIDAAIAGRPKPSSTDAGYSGASTPRVQGYAFVDAEPTPSELGVPVSGQEAERAEREAAMALLPRADGSEGRNPFKLQERSRREETLLRLVEGHDEARRRNGGAGGASRVERLRAGLGGGQGRTPTPVFASGPKSGGTGGGKKATGALTPAGRMLAARIGSTPARSGSLFDTGAAGDGRGRSLGKAWTPTPVGRRKEF